MWGALQSRGVTGGGEGVVEGVTLFPPGRQRVKAGRIQDPADFCRKTPAVFGAEVYRKSTGVSLLGKSSGKELPTERVEQVLLAQPVAAAVLGQPELVAPAKQVVGQPGELGVPGSVQAHPVA